MMVVAETPRLTYTHVTAVISVIKLIMEILKKSVKVYSVCSGNVMDYGEIHDIVRLVYQIMKTHSHTIDVYQNSSETKAVTTLNVINYTTCTLD